MLYLFMYLSPTPHCLYAYKQAKNVVLILDAIIHVVGSKFSCCNCTEVSRNTCRCNKAKTFSCEAYREYKFAFSACCASDNSPLHYMPTAIQRAVSFAPQPDAVTAVNELRVTACNDNGFCQYDEPSRSTYVATTAKQRAGNVRGNDVA